MSHTLFLESNWEIYGTFYDIDYQPFLIEGNYTFAHNHQPICKAQLLMHSNPQIEFSVTYYMNSTTDGAITWQSINSILGTFNGKMVAIEDTILSSYESLDLINSGIESYHKINDIKYVSKGTFLKGSQRLSSWSIELNQVLARSNQKNTEQTFHL